MSARYSDGHDNPYLAAAQTHTASISEIMQVIVLLQLVPRLQALHLHYPGATPSYKTWNNPVYQLTILPPTLRDFTYEWRFPCNWIDIDNLLSLLRLPSVRSITIPGWLESRLTTTQLALLSVAAGTS